MLSLDDQLDLISCLMKCLVDCARVVLSRSLAIRVWSVLAVVRMFWYGGYVQSIIQCCCESCCLHRRHFDVDILSSSESALAFARFLPCPIQSNATRAILPAAQYDLFSRGWSLSASENEVDVQRRVSFDLSRFQQYVVSWA